MPDRQGTGVPNQPARVIPRPGDLIDVPAGADPVCTTHYRVRVESVTTFGVGGHRERADGKPARNRFGEQIESGVPWNVIARSHVVPGSAAKLED